MIKFLIRLALLPLKLAWLTIQYYTTGTCFDNEITRKSLWRTLNCGIFQHMGPGLNMTVARPRESVQTIIRRLAPKWSLPGIGQMFPCSTNATWLAQGPQSELAVLYLHGGCFALQLQDSAVEAMANLHLAMAKLYNRHISVVVADYGLTSEHVTFPTQGDQVGAVYRQLLEDGYENIVVMGDSAGGNLSLTLLHYIDQNQLKWPRAVVAISPWLNTTYKLIRSLAHLGKDVFSYDMIDYFGAYYANGANDSLLNLTHAPYLKKYPPFADGKVYFIYGEYEVLFDEITEFIGTYAKEYPENILVDPKGVHIGWFISETCAYGTLDSWIHMPTSQRVLSWLSKIKT